MKKKWIAMLLCISMLSGTSKKIGYAGANKKTESGKTFGLFVV